MKDRHIRYHGFDIRSYYHEPTGLRWYQVDDKHFLKLSDAKEYISINYLV